MSKKEKKKKVSVKKNIVKKKNVEKKVAKTIHMPMLLRGMKDILPREELLWKKMYRAAENISESYGYGRIETPVMEEASLFARSIGKETDVIEKEMYIFEDKDGDKVALRPEMTAGIARSYISHGMHSQPQPIKVWYWESMFRHDRPQSGRFREFHQFGCEVLGGREAAIDAELIAVAHNFLRDLGLSTVVHVNSIGSIEDRQRYILELVAYLRSKRNQLCEDCRRRLTRNPLRILDCKKDSCRPIIAEAPQIVDWLGENSKKFFMLVLEYLDELAIPYVLDSTLVRGLDYYCDTVFELFAEDAGEEAQNALGGGGRYDGLVQQLGGIPTPASGFAIGVERVLTLLRKQPEIEVLSSLPRIFFAQLGEQARKRALVIIEELRRSGVKVTHNLGKPSLKAQMELANKVKVTHTLILGQKEVQDSTIIIRDMESGIQEIVDQKKIKNEIKKIIDRAMGEGKKK